MSKSGNRNYLLAILGTVIVVLLILIVPFSAVQGALFSPGAGVHSGKVGCDACHLPFQSKMSCESIACHPAVRNAFKTDASYKFHRQVAVTACTSCHSEHAGRQDAWASRRFRHDLFTVAQSPHCQTCHTVPTNNVHADYAANKSCLTCHNYDSWQTAVFQHSQLSQAQLQQCANCHARPKDSSHARYTNNCAACHVTSTWQKVSFNHSQINQSEVSRCINCHARPADSLHTGYSNDCATCHNTSSWQNVRFDHSLISGSASCISCHNPPQDRVHSLVSSNCVACHNTAAWQSVAFNHGALTAQGLISCGVCHSAPQDVEEHQGVGLDCGRCHSTQSWSVDD